MAPGPIQSRAVGADITVVRRFHSTLLAARFRFDQQIADRGANLVEYLLLVAFLAILVMAAVQLFGNTVGEKYSTVADSLP